MRVFLLLLVSLPLGLFGQEVVATFPMGNAPGQLGLNARLTGSDEFQPAASGIASDGRTLYVIDNVNSRIVTLAFNGTPTGSFPTADSNLISLWMDGKVMIQGFNTNGPDKFFHTSVTLRNDSSGGVVVLEQEQFLKNWETYGYLTFLGNIAYFQGREGEYFGVRIVSSGKNAKGEIVPEDQLRQEFASLKQTRYRWVGDQFFDHDQLISSSREVFAPYFQSLPEFDIHSSGPYTSSRLIPLANGTWLLQYGGSFRQFDTSGRKLLQEVLDYEVSQFAPTPDGYVYFLHPDYKKDLTELMRMGPYPEIRLDYHGRGGTINEDNVNLHEEASTKAVAVTKLSKGTPVRILGQTEKTETIAGQKGVWYQVRLWDRTEGWVFGAFVDIAKP